MPSIDEVVRTPPALSSVGLQAMVVSRDLEATNLFRSVLEEMGILAQHSRDESEAGAQLEHDRFEAVILDFDTIARTALVLDSLRTSRSSHGALLFGLASDTAALQRALEQTSNVCFHRPLQRERVASVVRAGYGLMLRDRRRYFRYGVSVPVRLKRKDGEYVQCTSINISQNGAALSVPVPLDLGEELEIFFVPDVDGLILARGVVIWHDRHGKAGLRFDCCTEADEKRLADWLDTHFLESVSKSSKNESKLMSARSLLDKSPVQ